MPDQGGAKLALVLTSMRHFALEQEIRAWRMDAFYRQVRRRLDILMVKGKPLRGRFSFDAENRKAWRGEPPEPQLRTLAIDDITAEVCELVRTTIDGHPECLTPLYWAFLGRHRSTLANVDRMKLPMASEGKRTAAQRKSDSATFDQVPAVLSRGKERKAP